MAGIQKKALLLIFILFLTVSASSLNLDIGLEPKLNHSVKDIQQTEEFENVFEINASVRNIGSFECSYRLRADINETQSNDDYRAYSRSKVLWPSEVERMKVYASPQNYTGLIEGNLYLQYCGEQKFVKEFNATSTNRTVFNKNVSKNPEALEELSVNDTEAKIKSNLTDALLVPIDYPAFWKTGYADLRNSTAELDYEASVFTGFRNITYAAFNRTSKKPVGMLKTDLRIKENDEEQLTYIDRIRKNKYIIGFAASAIVNFVLILSLVRIRRKS